MRVRRFVVLVLLSALLAGCWSRRELTEVSFVGAIGIDWVDGEFQVSLAVIQPRKQVSEQGGPPASGVWTVAERGPAITAALAKLDQTLERAMTLTHVRVIVFGREMAEHGIGPTIDFLLRGVEIRPTAWVAVTNSRAVDLLQARPRQERVPTDGPLGYQDVANRRSSITPARRLTQVAELLQEEGISLTLPLFRLGSLDAPNPEQAMDEGAMEGRPENAREIIYGGAGIFRDDRLVGWLTPEQSRGHLWGINQIVHGVISADCLKPKPDERVVFHMRKSAGRSTTSLTGGKLRGLVRVQVVADIHELTCAEPILRNGDTSVAEALMAQRIRANIEKALAVSRATGADFFGFGQSLFRAAPAEFKARQSRWEEELRTMPITVEVQTRVARTEQITQRYRWRKTR